MMYEDFDFPHDPLCAAAQYKYDSRIGSDSWRRWHTMLTARDVRAYRYNDRFVNREECIVTFFFRESTLGAIHCPYYLDKGDLIFIGDLSFGGRYALIERRLNNDCSRLIGGIYKYRPIDAVVDGMIDSYTTELTQLRRKKFWKGPLKPAHHLALDICTSSSQLIDPRDLDRNVYHGRITYDFR